MGEPVDVSVVKTLYGSDRFKLASVGRRRVGAAANELAMPAAFEQEPMRFEDVIEFLIRHMEH